MSATSEEVRALARRFAAALRHLRDTHELHYVGARPMPRSGVVASTSSEPEPHEVVPPVPAATARPAEQRVQPPTIADRPGPRAAATSLPIVESKTVAPEVAEIADKSALRERAAGWSAATKLEYLRHKNIGDCRRCSLCRTRTNLVFGVGNPDADLMFVGEAPGADEDRQGEPFVGRAGQLLDQWITALGLRREDVYIANVLKCRPPGNRDPRPEEVDRCAPFLKAQIRAIEPKVIVALGRHAGMLLAKREDLSLRAMRTQRLFYDASAANDSPGTRAESPPESRSEAKLIPLVVTYHPAYVLRQEGPDSGSHSGPATEAVFADLQRALQLVAAPAR